MNNTSTFRRALVWLGFAQPSADEQRAGEPVPIVAG